MQRQLRHRIAQWLFVTAFLIISPLARAESPALPHDTLVRGGLEQLRSLDPLDGMDELHATVFLDVFEGLLEVSPEGKIAPAIAESWRISADGKTYTFKLRHASWSNGVPIVAKQFVDALLRALSPQSNASQLSMLYPINNAEAYHNGEITDPELLGIEAIDDYTLRLQLHTPTAHFLSALAYRYLTPLLDEKLNYRNLDADNIRSLPFNGPYTISAHENKVRVELKKNPSYWDHEQVAIPKVHYLLGSHAEQWENYKSGKLDYIQIIPTKSYQWAKENIPSEILIAPQFATYFYELDLRYPQLQDPRVRKALNLTVNREALAESAVQPGHLPTESIVPPHLSQYEPGKPSWSNTSYEERIRLARALMADAGYQEQAPLKFTLAYNTSDDHKRVAEAVVAQWQQHLPVEVEMRHFAWGDYKLGRREMRVGMINRYGWSGDYMDPLAFLAVWRPDSPINYMGYDNPRYAELLQQASVEQNSQDRYAILQQAEAQIIEDNIVIPLFHYARRSAIKPRVYDWESNTGFVLMSKHLSIE